MLIDWPRPPLSMASSVSVRTSIDYIGIYIIYGTSFHSITQPRYVIITAALFGRTRQRVDTTEKVSLQDTATDITWSALILQQRTTMTCKIFRFYFIFSSCTI